MDKKETLKYIAENFSVSGEAFRLIDNILEFVSKQEFESFEQQRKMLNELLDGTIGLTEEEIEKISL